MSEYNRKDYLYKRAKDEGFRSRAAYKLREINDKYRIISSDSLVLDLGAWPGGWLQYISTVLGPKGKAVGIDLQKIDDLADERISCIQGDIRDENVLNEAKAISGSYFTVVVSDMSPKLSGIKEADQAACVGLAESALEISRQMLKPGGSFICKVFKGAETDNFVKTCRLKFQKVIRSELDATRKTSNEFYIIGTGFK